MQITGHRTKCVAVIALFLATGTAAAADDLMTKARVYFTPIPTAAPEIQDNLSSPEKIDLGKMLFFEPRLSKSGAIACVSCHNVGMGGDDNMGHSIGHLWNRGGRSAPTVLNAVFNVDQFWDGRADDLKAQAVGPMQADVEMNNSPEQVVATLNSMPEYVALFQAAFPGEDTPVSLDNAGRAIEVFEATLTTPGSPFDRYLRGDSDALTEQQKRGLAQFIDGRCVECHSGVNIGGDKYEVFGKVQSPGPEIRPPDDVGRAAVTGRDEDKYVFRVAPLRNIALTAPYFHSGVVWDLGEAVKVMAKAQLGNELSDADAEAVVAFLNSLTGIQPSIEYPILPPRTATTPRPSD